ncbi:glycosyltransferase family 2 protein [uncultured Sunxiuqinia sp.]|uniref:glycosyltransferase family 2 protein n=1 Tax=uncultured Sunxiuqinia sp. TaxID=1573825 RepID=UPI002AA73D5A|nr:glycosyltransferase family 2 protein [uncultured Sunxiuqinia sp.]
MKITLITATYNSYPNILDTLDSIQQQTHPDIEWVVIDGGSTDLTRSVIKSTPLISQSISEPDQGIYDALNKGIQRTTGNVIGFVHSDDLLASPKILETIAQVFEKTTADGVYGNLVYVDKQDTNKIIRYWKSKPFRRRNLTYGWMPAHPTLFLKKEVYKKHGLFDLDFKIAADYDFMLRILKDPGLKFEYLPQVITKMRIGGASNKSLNNILQKSQEDLRAMRKNGLSFPVWSLACKNLSKLPQFLKR